jgi:hypothetical protein
MEGSEAELHCTKSLAHSNAALQREATESWLMTAVRGRLSEIARGVVLGGLTDCPVFTRSKCEPMVRISRITRVVEQRF